MLTGYSLLTHNYELSYVQTMCKETIDPPIVDTIKDADQNTRKNKWRRGHNVRKSSDLQIIEKWKGFIKNLKKEIVIDKNKRIVNTEVYNLMNHKK